MQILDDFCPTVLEKRYKNSCFAYFHTNRFALIRESYTFIRKTFTFIRKSFTFIRESFAFIWPKLNGAFGWVFFSKRIWVSFSIVIMHWGFLWFTLRKGWQLIIYWIHMFEYFWWWVSCTFNWSCRVFDFWLSIVAYRCCK